MSTVACNDLPTPEFAARVASSLRRSKPSAVRRFPTGSMHFVFEVELENGDLVVVRASRPAHRDALAGNAQLTRLLRPMGVPLPEIRAAELDGDIPYLILERLPGSDLGHLMGSFPDTALEAIAAHVADAQAITARMPTAGRYGYAAAPQRAPYATWAEVLDANLARSRRRMEAAQVFDLAIVDKMSEHIDGSRTDLDAIPAIPFLHDTTTKNVIVTAEGMFSGIVDVDDLCFGDPRYVIALTEAALIAFGGPRRYTATWLNITNQADDHLFRLYVSLFLVDFMSEHAEIFNGNQRPLSGETQQRLVKQFYTSLAASGHLAR